MSECPSTGVAGVALSGLGCGRKGFWRKNMCQISCADHSAVVTPDKGCKPKKERELNMPSGPDQVSICDELGVLVLPLH